MGGGDDGRQALPSIDVEQSSAVGNIFYVPADQLQATAFGRFDGGAVTLTGEQLAGTNLTFINADTVDGSRESPPHPAAAQRPAIPETGWFFAGPGRTKGSGLDMRESLHKVLVVMLATAAWVNLQHLFHPDELDNVNMEGLKKLRFEYRKVTDKALATRAWDLARSGSVGLMIKFASGGSRDGQGRHLTVAVEAYLRDDAVVCACSEAEACLRQAGGCSLLAPMTRALDAVRRALGVTMSDVFCILSPSCRQSALAVGRAITYGPSLCLVRMVPGSWPFATVRKTVRGLWICFACRTSDTDCQHTVAASAAAKRAAAGEDSDTSGSDGDCQSENGDTDGQESDADVDMQAEDGAAHEVPNGVEADVGANGNRAAAPKEQPAPNRRKLQPQSMLPRHAVPPSRAQLERALMVQCLRDPSVELVYFPATSCPFCLVGRGNESGAHRRHVRVECGEGVAVGTLYYWRCPSCLYRVIPDGRDRGVVFTSSSTAYSEVFLFETALGMSRCGASLQATAYMREAFHELSHIFTFPLSNVPLHSVTSLRKAVIHYLSLVIAGLPGEVTQCKICRRADGSYAIICFDGLQLGYKLKFVIAFTRTSVPIAAIPRASLYAHAIMDEALSKALGRVLTSAPVITTAAQKPITTIVGMRGHVMALVLVAGYAHVNGVPVTLAGDGKVSGQVTKNRGGDPAVDGGVRPELFVFFRSFFNCRRVARSLALTIQDAASDLRRRVPVLLMRHIDAIVADREDDHDHQEPAAREEIVDDGLPPPGAGCDPPACSTLPPDASTDEGDQWASDGEDSGGSESDDGHDDGNDVWVAPRVNEAPKEDWDSSASLFDLAEQLNEPALADTGGAEGVERQQNLVLPLLTRIPSTGASTSKLLDFVRAVVVDPFTVWAPGNSWSAVDAILVCVLDRNFSLATMATVLDRPDVRDQRLLRGAAACLGPALSLHTDLRSAFAGVLKCLKETGADYDKFVADATPTDADEAGGSVDGLEHGEVVGPISREAMAAAHPSYAFTPQQFTETWIDGPASPEAYSGVYGLESDQGNDYLRSGIWAPGLPVLRVLPGFVGASTAQTDQPDCRHEMGKQKSRTAGTFAGHCTCAHPKCLGVVVLDGAEGQRMPLEFVVQRFATLPDAIVYDFACAALKTALVRLPHVAKNVAMRVDRFHWRKNHTSCSEAMCPDSFVCMDGTNTSSSEERNAISRRQQHHLRQMKQNQFIIFSIYQQAVGNIVAMYRDETTDKTVIKWPEWYRRMHVDRGE